VKWRLVFVEARLSRRRGSLRKSDLQGRLGTALLEKGQEEQATRDHSRRV